MNSFSRSADAEKNSSTTADISKEPISITESEEDLPLFEITELNGIDDRMTRGIAKKIFTAGKRAEKSRREVISDIRDSLKSADKLDDSTAEILINLEDIN